MGQSAEQSRDDFKDVQEEQEVEEMISRMYRKWKR